MDTPIWRPMRWPCGPLEIERGTSRPGFSTDEREALERWGSPRSLERLEGTPFNCLVVAWADGSPTDASQQQSLASLITAARGAGLAVVGEVAEGADLRLAATAADSAGLQALATESPEPLEGFTMRGNPASSARSLTCSEVVPRAVLGYGKSWCFRKR